MGFRDSTRNNNGNWQNNSYDGGFRNDANRKSDGFRNNPNDAVKSVRQRDNGGFRNNNGTKSQPMAPQNNGGFRSNDSGSGLRNKGGDRKVEMNSEQKKQAPPIRTYNNTELRFTRRKFY